MKSCPSENDFCAVYLTLTETASKNLFLNIQHNLLVKVENVTFGILQTNLTVKAEENMILIPPLEKEGLRIVSTYLLFDLAPQSNY